MEQLQEMAKKLSGYDYGDWCNRSHPILQPLIQECKEKGIVIVRGSSDDLVEFDGAWYDETGVWSSENYYSYPLFVDSNGLIGGNIWEKWKNTALCIERKTNSRLIQAIWGDKRASWTYQTNIRHCEIEIPEDDHMYCVGIIFYAKDV